MMILQFLCWLFPQMTLQFCVWDKVKVMSEMTPFNLRNLGNLLAYLIAGKALSLSVFKVSTNTHIYCAENCNLFN